MTYKILFWIYFVKIYQVLAADSEVLSTGAIIGLICGILFFIAAIVIVVFLCLNMRWRHLERQKQKKAKTRTLPQSAKPSKSTDTSLDRLPDIPEEDESIRNSPQSVRDESSVIFQAILPDLNRNQQNDMDCSGEMNAGDENEKTNIVLDIVTETSERFEADDTKKNAQIEENEQESEEDIVKNIQESNEDIVKNIQESDEDIVKNIHESDEDIVKNFEEKDEEENTENKSSEILITRVVENENVLRKDIQHLNSTENIFSDYDAAMTYEADSNVKSRSDGNLNIKFIPDRQKEVKRKTFEFTQDDSDLNLKSGSKLEAEKQVTSRNNKSEGNLIDVVKRKPLTRNSSLISRITSKSFEWNFDYISPYAMSEKQKQESLERKAKMQKRRMQVIKHKREEKEKKRQENKLAFKKWKLEKNENTYRNSELVETGSIGSRQFERYRYWYP